MKYTTQYVTTILAVTPIHTEPQYKAGQFKL